MESFSLNTNFHVANPAGGAPAPSAQSGKAQAPDKQAAPAEVAAPPTAEELEKAAEQLQRHYQIKVEMSSDETTGRTVARIMSPDGERLLRQIPPEKVLAMAEAVKDGSGDGLLSSVV